MKVTLPANELASAIKWAQGAVSSKTMMAVLAGVHLEAADGRLTVRATDLEYGAVATIPAQIDEPGTVLAPRRIGETVSRLPNDGVSLNASDRLEVSCGSVKAALRTIAVEDFPALADPEPDVTVELDAATVELIAKSLAQWVKPDSDHPSVRGVVVRAGDGRMRIFGTDSYRLGMLEIEADGDVEAIVPPGLFTVAARLGCDVTFGIEDRTASMVTADRTLTSRLIEGRAANLAALMPDSGNEASLDRGAAIEALSRSVGFTSGTDNIPARIEFSDGSVSLSTNIEGETLDEAVEGTGPDLTIHLNPAFLLSALRAIEGDTAHLLVRDPRKPIVLTGADERLTTMLMPMQVAS